MKFRLVEDLNKYYYHISNNDFNKFRINEEGIHLAETIQGAKYVMNNRDKTSGILYTVKFTKPLKELFIDLDTMRWTAPEIAKLFIAKINNETVSGSAGENDEEGNNYKDDLSPDLIHIDNLTEKDLPKLKEIANEPADIVGLIKIGNFINSKGYNAINYELAEDNQQQSRTIMIWNPNMIEIIDKQQIDI